MSAYIKARQQLATCRTQKTQCIQDPLKIMRKSICNTCVCALQTDDVDVRPIVETLDKEVETQVLTHKVSRDGSTVYKVLEEMEKENKATKLRLEAEEKRVRELEDKLYTVQQELEVVESSGLRRLHACAHMPPAACAEPGWQGVRRHGLARV